MTSKIAAYVFVTLLGICGATTCDARTAGVGAPPANVVDAKDIGATILGIGALAGVGMVTSRRKNVDAAREGQQTADA